MPVEYTLTLIALKGMGTNCGGEYKGSATISAAIDFGAIPGVKNLPVPLTGGVEDTATIDTLRFTMALIDDVSYEALYGHLEDISSGGARVVTDGIIANALFSADMSTYGSFFAAAGGNPIAGSAASTLQAGIYIEVWPTNGIVSATVITSEGAVGPFWGRITRIPLITNRY